MKKGECKFRNDFARQNIWGKPAICDAGVNVRELVGGPDDGWLCRIPCMPGGHFHNADEAVSCPSFTEPTQKEVDDYKRESDERVNQALAVLVVVSKAKQSGESNGKVDCPNCDGKIHWSKSEYNGHVHAKCDACDVGFME